MLCHIRSVFMNTVEAIRNIEQINQMKEYLKSRSPRDYCFFMLGINTGIRINDLLNILVKDVMTTEKEIRHFLQTTIYVNPPVYLNIDVQEAIKNNIQTEQLQFEDFLFK